MPFRIRVSLAILLGLLTLLFVGPLITPVRPLSDTVPIRDLADNSSQFIEIDGLDIHYKTMGDPAADQVFLLLHGFGAHSYTWHELMPNLADRGYVIAYDRPAFGLTERPLREDWDDFNPYAPDSQLDILDNLLVSLSVEKAVLIGHSTGARLGTEFALQNPAKVAGLILIDAAIYNSGGRNGLTRLLFSTPQMNRIGPLLMRQFGGKPGLDVLRASWANPEAIDEETLKAYQKPLQVSDWDKALWEHSKASQAATLINDLPRLSQDTLVLTGLEDNTVAPELSKRLSEEIPNTSYKAYEACGHVPHEECPEKVLETINNWLDEQIF